MKHFLRICTACAAVVAASTLPAVEVILDGCRSTAGWNSFNGSEFKGAKVSLSGGADGLKLGYDFAGGGQYVGCHPKKLAVPQAPSSCGIHSPFSVQPARFRSKPVPDTAFSGNSGTSAVTDLIVTVPAGG